MQKTLHKKSKISSVNFCEKIIISTLVFTLTTSIVLANDGGVSGVVGDMNAGTGVYGTFGEIIGILSWLGFLIAIGKMIQIGIMFMIGAGKSKSDAKASLFPWIVGAFVCATFGTIGPAIIGLIMGGGSGGGVFDI